MINRIDFKGARQYALKRLSSELPAYMVYHSLWHTQNDVLPAAVCLARASGFDREGMLLMRTAAWYHDIGYLVRREEHEKASVDIARAVLPDYGYSRGQIERIGHMIMATRLPQSPHTPEGEILADADMDSLGRQDFLIICLDLKAELAHLGIKNTCAEWFAGQRSFLQSHTYFTESARRLRNTGKKRNIEILSRLVKSCENT